MAAPPADSGTGTWTTSDGVALTYEHAGLATNPGGPILVLLHGWSASRRSFQRNTPGLVAGGCRVYALDQRHHGDSAAASPPRGYHVARLAADLHNFLTELNLKDVTVVGTSLGAAVIWSFVELAGPVTSRMTAAVFVDQAPLQNCEPDWSLGSRGCFDADSLAALQAALADDLGGVADGNVACCVSLPLPDAVLADLRAETLRCSPVALGKLMADHTQADWRPVLPLLQQLPCLNVVGGTSGCFPREGCLEVGKLAKCCSVVFERANHWLYLEMPEAFNELLLDFVKRGNEGRPALASVE